MISTTQASLEIAQYSVDPKELRHIFGFAPADYNSLMLATNFTVTAAKHPKPSESTAQPGVRLVFAQSAMAIRVKPETGVSLMRTG
jgi:hypothetical protein